MGVKALYLRESYTQKNSKALNNYSGDISEFNLETANNFRNHMCTRHYAIS